MTGGREIVQVEGNNGPGTLLYGHDFYQSPQQDAGDPALAASEDADGDISRYFSMQPALLMCPAVVTSLATCQKLDHIIAGLAVSRKIWHGQKVAGGLGTYCVIDCRRALLQERDVVAHLCLSQHLKEQLAACQAVHGRAFESAFSQLSPNVAEQLKGALG